jgi:hypothetical protein
LLDDKVVDINSALSRDFRYEPGKLTSKVNAACEMLKMCAEDLQQKGQSIGHLQVWKQRRMPKHTYYRFEDEVFLVPYNLSLGRPKIPVIGFTVKEGGAGQFLKDDFEALITGDAELFYDSHKNTDRQ